MKVSKDFILQEFIPLELWAAFGIHARRYVTPFQVNFAQTVRTITARKTTVNNWYFGGTLSERGTRMPKSRTGAKLSMHKFAQGVDISVQGLSVAEIYELVISRKRLFMSIGLNRIEDISFTPTWLHADSAWTAHDDILIVKPKIVYPSFGDLSSDDIYKLYDI